MTITKLVAGMLALAIAGISTFSATAEATSVERANNGAALSTQFIESIKERTLEVVEYTDGLSSVQSIKNVDALVDAVKQENPSISDYQLGKSVLIMLGDDEDFVNSLPTEKVLEALEYTSVERTDVYLRETQNGELVQISKSEYDADNATAATQATIPSYSETFGKLVLRSTAYKRNPTYALSGRDYYSIRGEVIWEGYPFFHMTDLMVISSTGNIDNNYDCTAYGVWGYPEDGFTITDYAHLRSQDGGNGEYLKLSAPSVYGMGVSMPTDIGDSNFSVEIDHVYAYYGVSSQTDITCQVSYAHAILAWTPSFSVSSVGTVSFGGIGVQRETFYGTPFTLYHS